MNTTNRSFRWKRAVWAPVLVGLCGSMLGGVGCGTRPPLPLPANALLSTTAADSGFCFAVNPCGQANGGFTDSFTPGSANRMVTVAVNADLTNSRPFIEVVDPFGGVVASSVLNPSSSNARISFNPSTTGMHVLNVCDCGEISPTYSVSVMQAAAAPVAQTP